jgi:UDP-N-acetylglucosamine transferase subunit ALG13
LIFVTVGSMLGFDRLIRAMDEWAAHHPTDEAFAQVGDGRYQPERMRWTRLLPPGEFKATLRQSKLLVAHAGMGSFFMAMEAQRPIVMMPRLAARHEHTTDHQVHTLRWISRKPGVYAANSEAELPGAIERALNDSTAFGRFERFASPAFVARLRESILN